MSDSFEIRIIYTDIFFLDDALARSGFASRPPLQIARTVTTAAPPASFLIAPYMTSAVSIPELPPRLPRAAFQRYDAALRAAQQTPSAHCQSACGSHVAPMPRFPAMLPPSLFTAAHACRQHRRPKAKSFSMSCTYIAKRAPSSV